MTSLEQLKQRTEEAMLKNGLTWDDGPSWFTATNVGGSSPIKLIRGTLSCVATNTTEFIGPHVSDIDFWTEATWAAQDWGKESQVPDR